MNILAIGAHFDDVELGCGGTLAKHVKKGDKVYIYVATVSGYSNYARKVLRDSDLALKEGLKAAEVLGAEIICGNFETLRLEFTEELNVQIVKIVEEKNIDLIYSHWIGDTHHDHVALAKASLHSGRHVKRLLIYRSNWYHSTIDFRGNFYVDITGTWDTKEKAIRAHESEFKRGVGKKWLGFFKNEAENAGLKIGVRFAEVFEVVKWLDI